MEIFSEKAIIKIVRWATFCLIAWILLASGYCICNGMDIDVWSSGARGSMVTIGLLLSLAFAFLVWIND